MIINIVFPIFLLNYGVIFIDASLPFNHFIKSLENFIKSLDDFKDQTIFNIPMSVVDISYLPDYVIPKQYTINIANITTIHIKESNKTMINFTGTVSAVLEILRQTNNICLHVLQPYINVLRFRISMMGNNNRSIHLYPSINIYDPKTNIACFIFDKVLPVNYYSLYIIFKSITHEKMFFIIPMDEDRNKTLLIVTNFQAIGARGLFPCWDEPRWITNITIVIRHDENYTALSNMPIERIVTQYYNTQKVTEFFPTPEMSVSLLSFMIFYAYPSSNASEVVKIWCRQYLKPHRSLAQKVAQKVLQHLNSKWKDLNKLSKVHYIGIPDFQNDDIKYWRYVLCREDDIIYNKELNPSMHAVNVIYFIARKTAGQWFGNALTSFWQSHFWLNDGIVTLLGMDSIKQISPWIYNLFVVQIQQESLHIGSHFMNTDLMSEVITSSKIDSIFSFHRYIRAPAILRMLQYTLSDIFLPSSNIFWRVVRKYINMCKDKSSTPETLWRATENILRSESSSYMPNVTQIMNSWTKKMYHPVLNIKHIPFHNKTYVRISVDNVRLLNQDGNNWWIPLTITAQSIIKNSTYETVNIKWLSAEENVPYSIFPLPYVKNSWIIVNLQQIGHYRINYDSVNWLNIVTFLHTKNYRKIHVLNRAQIIDDAFHLMLARQFDNNLFWKLVDYLSYETNYIAWYPMFKALEYMSNIFNLVEELKVVIIKERLNKIFSNVLQKIGYDENENIHENKKILRQEVAKWACTLNLPECIEAAKLKLTKHFENIDTNKLLPWWKQWTYCHGITIADKKTWITMTTLLNVKYHTRKILEYLSCTKRIQTIYLYLSLAREEQNDLKLQVNDRINIFLLSVTKHLKFDEVFEHILRNFHIIKPKEISIVAAVTCIINHVNTEKQLNAIREEIHRDIIKDMNKQLILDIESKIKVRWLQIMRQTRFLMEF